FGSPFWKAGVGRPQGCLDDHPFRNRPERRIVPGKTDGEPVAPPLYDQAHVSTVDTPRSIALWWPCLHVIPSDSREYFVPRRGPRTFNEGSAWGARRWPAKACD